MIVESRFSESAAYNQAIIDFNGVHMSNTNPDVFDQAIAQVLQKFPPRVITVDQKISDFFPQFKDRLLAAFHDAVAELEIVADEKYALQQGIALGLLAALLECGFIEPAECHALALTAKKKGS